MNKENILFGLVGLLLGALVSWACVTSYTNNRYNKMMSWENSGNMMGQPYSNNYNNEKDEQGMMMSGSMMGAQGHSMGQAMTGMMQGLDGKTGDDFDKAFVSEMIIHHQGAIDMANLALTNAKHQELKDLAKAIITAQTKEISQMKAWQLNWYNIK